MLEQLLSSAGFIYNIQGTHYYLGKWICKPCTDTGATDCVMMYEMCRNSREEQETAMYYHKIRAYSDFALEIPYNPVQIREDMRNLLEGLDDADQAKLKLQLQHFLEDTTKYCG